jgi:hypothetical protein
MKVRGPNKHCSKSIDLQDIRCSGTLTLAPSAGLRAGLSHECAGEGDTAHREKIDSLWKADISDEPRDFFTAS